MPRKDRSVNAYEEPEEILRLREDLLRELNAGTQVVIGRVMEVRNDGSLLIAVDSTRLVAENYAISNIAVGENVALVADAGQTAYVIGVRR